MILIGQYDSPFVRRVGVAMRLYDLSFEHRPWSTFGDADKIAFHNPLRRVPTLVLDDGRVLIDSWTILDWLDEQAGERKSLIAARGPARQDALKICALAAGLAEKAVALVYERVLHQETSQIWIDRCSQQIIEAIDALEAARAAGAYWFGERIGHADIAVACAVNFVICAHPGLFDPLRARKLAEHCAHCEALPVFQEIYQEFIAP